MKFGPLVKGIFVGCCAVLIAASASAQTKPQKPAEPQDDVIRVNTELVQTDVMVFDKDGHFVDGLKADQFALKIDNKATPLSFFERVAAGKTTFDRNSSSSNSASTSTNTTGSSP